MKTAPTERSRSAKTGANGKPVWQPRTKVMFAAWVTDVRFFKGDKNGDARAARASFKVTLDDQTSGFNATANFVNTATPPANNNFANRISYH